MSIRNWYLLGFIVTILILLSSIYFQFFDGFEPCPLCSLQRLTFLSLGILFLLTVICYPIYWCRRILGFLAILTSFLGVGLAARQVWLQHFPPHDNLECGVSLQFMMKMLPINEVIKKIFAGTAECTQASWTFLKLSMAEWSLIWFVMFSLATIYLFIAGYKQDIKSS